MLNNFNKWKSVYDVGELLPFTDNKEALLWLKVKSIVRKEIINEFCSENQFFLETTSLIKQFEELFNLLTTNVDESHKKLDSYILFKNVQILKELDQEKLVSELYKLQNRKARGW